ncbi:MAG TPA: CoA ester lyase [Acetobacteraceae bacterium]|nr:CoA ester lyase [Acetobacteraceae bacterium]
MMRLRSLLFAPGDSERKIAKALAGDADAVILDLEDAVAPPAKDAARASVAALLPGLARAGVIVRVNPEKTPWHLGDLAAVVPGRPAAILLPKCEGPEALLRLDQRLAALEAAAGLVPGDIATLALVTETAASVQALARFGPGLPRLIALSFGAEDLSADLGIRPRLAGGGFAQPIAVARALTLIAAAAAGVAAIDTPFPDPRDPAGLAAETEAAAADGFSGKYLIHPDQIAPAHAAFTPSPERVRWARAVAELFAANPEAGVMVLEGQMIDRPHQKLALRILAAAG